MIRQQTPRPGTGRKGIILAGGTGTRLYPITIGVSKQLMPIYDKPMIYYPLSVLMLTGIREIAVITTPHDQEQFQQALGDGSQWGLSLSWIVQPEPKGIAQALVLAEPFLAGAPSVLVLGDNIFYGHGLSDLLMLADEALDGATIFAYRVANPERYGVASFNDEDQVTGLAEKPSQPASNYAITGLYFFDTSAPARARTITPSHRGELEIISLLELYLKDKDLRVRKMGPGFAWLDTGTHDSLLDAGNFVRTLEKRQGLQSGCPEEIAYEQGWITSEALLARAALFEKTDYGRYLRKLIESD